MAVLDELESGTPLESLSTSDEETQTPSVDSPSPLTLKTLTILRIPRTGRY